MNCQSFSLGPRWHLPWRGSVPRRLEKQRKPGESARGRSNGVSKRVKRPIECGPSGIGRVLSPLVRAPSGTSKTSRSLLLAVPRSTINKPSEYMKLNNSAFAITSFKRRYVDGAGSSREIGGLARHYGGSDFQGCTPSHTQAMISNDCRDP